MENIMSSFRLNKEIRDGNVNSTKKCRYCNTLNDISTIHKSNKTKKYVFKCKQCNKINEFGDIYNFKTGNKLNHRLESYHDAVNYDKVEWSINNNVQNRRYTMIFKKDTIIKPIIKGIYISVTFNEDGELTDYKEIETNYLKDISLNLIKSLLGGLKAGKSGKFKAILTIKPENIRNAFNKYSIDFYNLIIQCLTDIEYKKYVSFVMYGYLDNMDYFDEFYDCSLCKYFLEFNRCPKIKFKNDISIDDVKSIIDTWLDFYFFNDLLINGKEVFSILQLATKHDIYLDDITYKINRLNNYDIYICTNEILDSFDLTMHIAQNNVNINENVYYTINNKLVSSNISNILTKSLINHNLVLKDGKLVKKEVK